MGKRRKRRLKQAGLPPGSLVYVGDAAPQPVRISLFNYTEQTLDERELRNIEEAFPLKDASSVVWVNIDGLQDISLIEKVGAHYSIHPLVLEDILHTTQRPKVEDHDNYLFAVVRMLDFDKDSNRICSEQVSFILTDHTVLSFQENIGDIFGIVRDRIRSGKGRIRKLGADYLLYALMDAIVDHYFFVLERMGDRIEELEEQILNSPNPEAARKLHELKREMIMIRKSVWPLREAVGTLERIDCDVMKDITRPFVRDLYDHTIQVIDSVESYRDLLSGMLEIHLASVSNKLNEVMKVLTIISTIFIPLTFIVGVYGMNFDYMPELRWQIGYPAVWAVMLAIAGAMLVFFRKKHWI